MELSNNGPFSDSWQRSDLQCSSYHGTPDISLVLRALWGADTLEISTAMPLYVLAWQYEKRDATIIKIKMHRTKRRAPQINKPQCRNHSSNDKPHQSRLKILRQCLSLPRGFLSNHVHTNGQIQIFNAYDHFEMKKLPDHRLISEGVRLQPKKFHSELRRRDIHSGIYPVMATHPAKGTGKVTCERFCRWKAR
jgi:hypothetical protein